MIIFATMKTILLCLSLFAANACFAQSKPFVIGETRTLVSDNLLQPRTLNIYLPEGYNKDSAITYPVIYVLDGSANEDFIHTAGLVQYLAMYEMMPKSIVVGIANVDRKKDFTFAFNPGADSKWASQTGSAEKFIADIEKQLLPYSGGSEKFMSFIEDELQPYIDANYHTNRHNTIIGQSLGGLLATEILLKKPSLFDDYIIVSPSLWWGRESLIRDAPALLKANLHKPVRAYIAVGKEGVQMEGDAKKLHTILSNTKNVKTWLVSFPNESHLTIQHNALYKGFVLMGK